MRKEMKHYRNLLILCLCIALPCTSVFGISDGNQTEETSGIEETQKEANEKQKTSEEVPEQAAEETEETTKANELEESTAETQTEAEETPALSELPAALNISRAGTADVNDWDEFVAALADTSVTGIDLKQSITRTSTAATSNPGTITRSLVINGNGNTINFGSGGGTSNGVLLNAVSSSETLTLTDVAFVKTTSQTTPIFNQSNTAASSNWNIIVSNVKTNNGNLAGLVTAEGASVTVYGTENLLELTGASSHFFVKNFEMPEGAVLKATSDGASNASIRITDGDVNIRRNAALYIENYGTSSGEGTNSPTYSHGIYGTVTALNLEAGALLDIGATSTGFRSSSDCYMTMVDGAVFNATSVDECAVALTANYGDSPSTYAEVNISGEGTQLNIASTSTLTANRGAAMRVAGDACQFNVKDGAEINAHHTRNSCIQFLGQGNVFNVTNGAKIEATQDGGTYALGATLRFRLSGGQTFNIVNAEVIINKLSGGAPGVRLYGGNNSINVTNGGRFEIYNAGDGSPNNGNGNAGNQGVYFTNGATSKPDSFYVEGYGSRVEITADYGPAVYNTAGTSSVSVLNKAIFILEGRTSDSDNGTINSGGTTTINLDSPLYFDIRNNRPGGGNAIDAGGSASIFTAVSSDLSVWTKGSDLDANASRSWSLFDYTLSGADFGTIVSTNVPTEFNYDTYGRASNYARISANNASAVIDELRVATNADNYIYGHAYVPEAIEEQRDAWTDEVYVTVQVKDTAGNVVFTGTGTTVGAANDNSDEGLRVYGEDERAGMFEILYDPDGDGTGGYLPADYTVEVVAAWRGGADSTSGRVHSSTADDLQAGIMTTRDVTPPKALTADDLDSSVMLFEGNLTTRTTGISGTAEEAGAAVYLYRNGSLWKDDAGVAVTATVGTDGTWSLTFPEKPAAGDVIAIALNDHVANATDLTKSDLVKLTDAGVFAHDGNENPAAEFAFHDAVFSERLQLDVVYYGALELVVDEEISYGTHAISPVTRMYGAQTFALGVIDDRVVKNPWELTAKLKQPFTLNAGSETLTNALIYSSGGTQYVLNSGATAIWQHTNTDNTLYDVYGQWSGTGDGLYVKAASGELKVGSYTAVVEWTLSDVP